MIITTSTGIMMFQAYDSGVKTSAIAAAITIIFLRQLRTGFRITISLHVARTTPAGIMIPRIMVRI